MEFLWHELAPRSLRSVHCKLYETLFRCSSMLKLRVFDESRMYCIAGQLKDWLVVNNLDHGQMHTESDKRDSLAGMYVCTFKFWSIWMESSIIRILIQIVFGRNSLLTFLDSLLIRKNYSQMFEEKCLIKNYTNYYSTIFS